ncbi:hypothetical protein F4861DRAFT_76450 [Xylaria intraflava]|nr:hypothetical protein F4861DRAFT_76450 [Xylaria intraflava]
MVCPPIFSTLDDAVLNLCLPHYLTSTRLNISSANLSPVSQAVSAPPYSLSGSTEHATTVDITRPSDSTVSSSCVSAVGLGQMPKNQRVRLNITSPTVSRVDLGSNISRYPLDSANLLVGCCNPSISNASPCYIRWPPPVRRMHASFNSGILYRILEILRFRRILIWRLHVPCNRCTSASQVAVRLACHVIFMGDGQLATTL